jgi:hypothetical protein
MLTHRFFVLGRIAIVAALTAPFVAAQVNQPPGAPGRPLSKDLPDLHLTITLPAQLGEVTPVDKPGDGIMANWKARLGKCDVAITFTALPNMDLGFEEPEDVSDRALERFREGFDPSFAYQTLELVNGAFGWAPYVALGWGPFRARGTTAVAGNYSTLGGLLEKHGYALEVIAAPAPDEASEKILLDFLRHGVVYTGKTRNNQWTDAEAKARWLKDAPPATHKKLKKILRSKHYIVLTDADGGQRFADKMEECYTAIQKTYPFPEVAGRALMPVFLFRTADEYFAFYAKVFATTVEEAQESAGVAYGDFYATWFEAVGDKVHIHEATHQIFDNRLRLSGGGSWFQEGVAEYMATTANDRNDAARAVKNRKHTPLAEFIAIEDLIAANPAATDKKGEDKAGSHYAQAALLIEFLRESPWGGKKFLQWVHAIGLTPDNDRAAIERATQAVYGASLAELEQQWIEYCKKR